MARRTGRIRACPYCGSTDIVPKILFGGPLAGVDNKDETYICRTCGAQAVPLDFEEGTEVDDFKRARESERQEEIEEPDFMHIPIVPLNTAPLFSLGALEMPIGKTVEVVDVSWNSGHFVTRDYHAPFLRYWQAISGGRYNAEQNFLMDLSGIEAGRPNFSALKKLIKHRYEIWLDLGIRNLQDLFDCFAMDISWAVAGTLTSPGPGLFEEMYDLSDRCLPCVYLDRKVLWSKEGAGPTDLRQVMRLLDRVGFEIVAVIDLGRLGARSGASHRLMHELEGADPAPLLGGGVTEGDLNHMKEIGLRGALMDPFTPAIEDIVREEGEGWEPTDHELIEKAPLRRESPDGFSTD
jgi:uncharacterized protein related to proFAR isomerase